jgi:hypothetical protein
VGRKKETLLHSKIWKKIRGQAVIIAQVAMEKTGEKIGYVHFDEIKAELKKILGLQ